MKHLTVRNVPQPIRKALEAEKRRRGTSLNQTVIDLLGQVLGVSPGDLRWNGLRRLSGTWTAKEQAEFEKAIAITEQPDDLL